MQESSKLASYMIFYSSNHALPHNKMSYLKGSLSSRQVIAKGPSIPCSVLTDSIRVICLIQQLANIGSLCSPLSYLWYNSMLLCRKRHIYTRLLLATELIPSR